MTIKTLCIFGTRPEVIKMAPVIKQLEKNSYFNNKVCVTGQHQQMTTSLFELFKIKPDFNLHVMTANQDLSHLTAKILTGLTDVFKQYTPDCVLVHGDTTTTLAASLSAYYHQIPVVHVEAGLRTGDIYSPWPEEVNRKLAGSLATIHFAPTPKSRQNLLREGVLAEDIFITGNTVIDALFEMVTLLETKAGLKEQLQNQFGFLTSNRKFILVTGHRRENFGQGFEHICKALAQIAAGFPDIDIVYPVHLNPNVQNTVKSLLSGINNIFLIEPVDYLPFVYLMKSSYLILTDSGGVQEEAPSLGKPVLVMREKTERPEAIDAGTVLLVGTDCNEIVAKVALLLNNTALYAKMSGAINPYGDGNAVSRIIDVLSARFNTLTESTATIEKIATH
ncbi:MAG: UDP-N-acetylglucosamine 2-epimerase (non-hydrolyzing) [Legionella sp.]|nr:UDP-N-acetylglucosamine 2-epimerase (non-hydrolyzing) [Legionella sp.]